MGLNVRQGPVLYCAFEAYGSQLARGEALALHYGTADVPFYVAEGTFDLSTKDGRAELGALLEDLRQGQFGGQYPVLIVLDTLAKALGRFGGDENSAKDVGAFNDAVAALVQKTGACVMVIHHSGKDASKGARGSSALLGAIDTELEVDGGRIAVRKQRDGELGEPLGFKLQPVAVGQDVDGDQITSCIVLPAAGSTPTTWKPSGKAAVAWSVLCDLGGAENGLVDRGALMEAFRARAYPTGTTGESTPRQALDRALGAFLERGLIEGPGGGPWRRAFRGG
jgi:hypothetical protein